MHPSLQPARIAARKAELRAEAGKLRREFCESAVALEPIVNSVQLGVDVSRELRRSEVGAPALFGIAVGAATRGTVPAGGLFGRILNGARLLAKFMPGAS